MDNKIYGECTACGCFCYRVEGMRHGDGQVDSESNPVWLLCDELDIPDGVDVQKINCGC